MLNYLEIFVDKSCRILKVKSLFLGLKVLHIKVLLPVTIQRIKIFKIISPYSSESERITSQQHVESMVLNIIYIYVNFWHDFSPEKKA